MNKFDKFEILKEWFYKEEDRKDSLNNSINIQLTILTAIIAAIYFYLTKFNYEKNYIYWLFIILMGITIIFWLISIYFLLKSYNNLYTGFEYKGFPNASFINIEYNNLKDYYEEYKDDLDKNLDELVLDNVENILIISLDNNVFMNDQKSGYLHKSKIHLMNCIFSLLFTTIVFSLNYIYYPKEEVIIVQLKDKIMTQRKPPPPPPPAQPRTIKESQVPKTPPPPPPKPKPKPKPKQ